MRARLCLTLAAAPAWALSAVPAWATDITGESDPVTTSTVNDGAADDVVILVDGVITVTSGAAVTIDSDNTVTNDGTIQSSNSDDVVGIRATSGRTSGITNNGRIELTETVGFEDPDGDGDFDGPLAAGSGRIGILIEGPDAFIGDVTQTVLGSITVESNNGAGLQALAQIDGDVDLDGLVQITGDDTVGVELQNGATGNVEVDTVVARGENARAVAIGGDVGGKVQVNGVVSATGFRETNRRQFEQDRAALDADDLLSGGAGLSIAGSVGDGVLITGVSNDSNSVDTDQATVQSFGDAPAFTIDTRLNPNATGDATIGRVVEAIAVRDDDGNIVTDADGNIVTQDVERDYGVINRGTIQASGVNDGFASTAILFAGSAGSQLIIDGGLFNLGTVQVSAFGGQAIAIDLAAGSQTARIDNDGSITSVTLSDGDDDSYAILVRDDASLASLTNAGVITARSNGDGGAAFAVVDASGTLALVENSGAITATVATSDGEILVGEAVAIDLSASALDTIVRQVENALGLNPSISGSIAFGSGADTLDIQAGTVTGDVSFGAGADTLTIDNGAELTGAVTDADGALVITVNNGRLGLETLGDLGVTSATFGADAAATFRVDLRTGSVGNTRLVAADTVDVAGGASIAPTFVGLGVEQATVELIRATNGINLLDGQDIADNLDVETPFLYNSSLAIDSDGAGDVISLSLDRKTAEELGLNPNQAAAFDQIIAAADADEDIAIALGNLIAESDFFAAYDQLLPDYSGGALPFTMANVDGGVGAVGNRLDVVRGGRDAQAGVWVQEFATYADRDGGARGPGYRGHGFGIALGFDRPLGPFYAVGVNLSGAASEFEQPSGFDQPLSVVTFGTGAYAAAEVGRVLLDGYAGAGVTFFESDRSVRFANLNRSTTAEWSGYHTAASFRAAMDFTPSFLFVRPALSLDFLRLDEEGYRESGGGTGIDLDVDERTSENASATASLTIGGRFGRDKRTWWSPRVRVGYRAQMAGDPATTSAEFIGINETFVLVGDELPANGFVGGFTFAAGSKYSSFAFDYDADVRDGFLQHTARIAFRFLF